METKDTLLLLKEQEQDYEWYPTTDAMIDIVFRDCGEISSILDIGAGDGRVLEQIGKLNEGCLDKYAIEMSKVHIENMPPDISIVGTDFRYQTLIDKKVDVIFCNPPYSEYEAWATQIIKEANAQKVYLILPSRWIDSKPIAEATKQRTATSEILWSGDFADADRRARAKVDIVKITISDDYARAYEREEKDPFDVWFNEYFAGFDKLRPVEEEEERRYEKPRLKYELLEGQNLIERLSQLYTSEMNALLNNYKTLSDIDAALLKELGVSVPEIKKALKLKIEGVKNKYWQELFDHLDKITNRLTSSSRKAMLEKLNASCNVDFSVENAYAIVLWVIKNANKYLDSQLVDMFKELSEPECVKNYKSNLKTWEKDGWRYKKDHTHYTLEYRIITSRYCAIEPSGDYYSYQYDNGLSEDCHKFINDIFTIANNLGFANMASSYNYHWASNQQIDFRFGQGKTLVKIRAFKNGNLHLKFDQTFIKTLNVEASRLLGWIKTPQEAAEEMGLDINFVKSRLETNLLFGLSEDQKLLAG